MNGSVIATIVTAVLSLAGTVITVLVANKQTLAALDKKSELSDAKLEAKLEKHMAVTDTKIEELTREVRAHNGFAQRLPVLEEKVSQLEREGRRQ